MGFNEDFNQLSERIQSVKPNILMKEATKMSMIVPFFQLLGYDVFNPLEFCPEYIADVGIKKGEKVDYAIIINNEPVILIECKSCTEILDKHSSQLFRYFSTSSAKFGILTNGLIYKFFTDLDESNKMDLTPFLEIDLENIKESAILSIKKFCKSEFDKDSIFSIASELKYTTLIKELFKSELENSSDDFTKLMISSIYNAPKTQKVIDKFKPIVKKSLNSFINELLNQKISSALNTENVKDKKEETEKNIELKKPTSKIITTEEEIQSFFVIRGILAETVDINYITYKDTESYFGILYKNNSRKPIFRLNLDSKRKQLFIPDENKTFERIYIESLNDLYNYKDKLIEVLKRYQ
ncbi:MAG: type I restriction enzyme HsdR N-terminal domain-containing protein [Lachnospiraceae bacterium]|nr:type I restriction enzyme HsdR N-terminal domain-containing protein [Lachnospiraceae bacterium]